jgi:hypothetical protein
LPSSQREAVALRYLAGFDYDACAGALGIDSGAVRVRVSRALASLRESFHRRGVVLSLAALGGCLDAVAAEPIPAPPATAITGWSSTALPPLTTLSTGAIVIMSASLVAAGLASVLVFSNLASSEAATPAPKQPAPPAAAVAGPPAATPAPAAVDPLVWLTRHQLADGSWSDRPAGAATPPAERVGTTARALLCFLGQGFNRSSPSPH